MAKLDDRIGRYLNIKESLRSILYKSNTDREVSHRTTYNLRNSLSLQQQR